MKALSVLLAVPFVSRPYQGHRVAYGQTLWPKYKQITFRMCSQTNGISLHTILRSRKSMNKILQILVSDDLQHYERRKCDPSLCSVQIVSRHDSIFSQMWFCFESLQYDWYINHVFEIAPFRFAFYRAWIIDIKQLKNEMVGGVGWVRVRSVEKWEN